MNRTLSLKRDTLAELTSEEMSDVVAARWTPSCPLFLQLSDRICPE